MSRKVYLFSAVGGPPMPDRVCAAAIFFVRWTGCQWNALATARLCACSTAHDRFQARVADGFYESKETTDRCRNIATKRQQSIVEIFTFRSFLDRCIIYNSLLYKALRICRQRDSNPHTPFGITDFNPCACRGENDSIAIL